jgi:hypothetical protein
MSRRGSPDPASLALLAAALSGCGTGLIDSEYRGDALYTVAGSVVLEVKPPSADLFAGLAWTEGGPEDALTVAIDRDDLAFTIAVFELPPAEAMKDTPGEGGVSFAVGLPLALEGDALELVGGARGVGILYTDGDLAPPPGTPPLPDGGMPPTYEEGFHALDVGDAECFDPAYVVAEVDPLAVELFVTGDDSATPRSGCGPPEEP